MTDIEDVVSPRSLRRRPLGEEVAEALRGMILEGELKPDDRLTQDDIGRRLGVSTTPVREGLLKLAGEGLVEVSHNRAFRIVRSTRQDIHDVYWSHAMLSGELTARACATGDRDLVRRLRDLRDATIEAHRNADAERMEAANWSFHRAINIAAAAPKLLLLLRTTLRFIPDHFYGLLPEWPKASERGHDAILAAIEAGDAEAAREAAAQHVREAGELLMRHFSDTGYWTRPGAGE